MDQAPGKVLGEFMPTIDAAFGAAGFAHGQTFALVRQIQDDLHDAQIESARRKWRRRSNSND